MAEAETQQSAPVVKPVQAKKVKIDGKGAAYFNTFAISFAIFFGVALIFHSIGALITSQTKGSWTFGIPFSGLFTSWDNSYVPNAIILAFLTLICGIAGLVSVNKITDADALKKAWKCNFKVFGTLSLLYAIAFIATCIYSVCSIKKGAGPAQKSLWLSGAIPTVVMGGVSCFIAFMSKSITAGKTALVRVMSYIALSVASIAFVMVFIDHFVEFYSKKSSSSYDDIDNYLDIWNSLLD